MISVKVSPMPQGFAAALAARARALGAARAEDRVRAARRDPWRWRTARLLWPLFGDR